jgi:hypothetical protein
MRPPRRVFRLVAIVGGLALTLVQMWPLPLFAQEGPESAALTPPARVARLAWTHGSVSFRPSGQEEWTSAVLNYPLTAGDGLWTEPDAEAGVQVSDSLIALAPTTELTLDRLDPGVLVATEPEGEVYLRIGRLLPGETYVLRTPRAEVTIATPGRYAIAAGTTEAPTLVTVLQGTARVEGPGYLTLRSGQTAVITGEANGGARAFAAEVVPARRDAFLGRMLARERPRPVPAAAVPSMVVAMPGGADLDDYGTWGHDPEYGTIWYPRVAIGWVPYRAGHWAYIAPWGWTWIDDAPWGFAPFHYGRWIEIRRRWAWVPEPVVVVREAPPYPVYAPALVTFFNVGPVGTLLTGSVGWVPLAPFEPYHPGFHASPRYLREVNDHQVRSAGAIAGFPVGQVRLDRFHNRRAATVVPASALAVSRPIGRLARPAPAGMLTAARPVVGRAPVPPTTATLGVTPALARRQHIAPPPAGLTVAPRRPAPGPNRGAAVRVDAAGQARPTGGLPPLAAPTARRPAAGRAGPGPGVSGASPPPGAPTIRFAPAPRNPRPGAPSAPSLRGMPAPGSVPSRPRPEAHPPVLRAPGAAPSAAHPSGSGAFRATPQPPAPTSRPHVSPPPGPRMSVPPVSAPRVTGPAGPSRPGRPIVPSPARPPAPSAYRQPSPRVPAPPLAVSRPAPHPAPLPTYRPPPAYRPQPSPRPTPPPAYRPSPAYRPPPAYRPQPPARPTPPPQRREERKPQ